MSTEAIINTSSTRRISVRSITLVIAFALLAISTMSLTGNLAFASVTKVGNGDDGGDLEGGTKVTGGMLIETRAKALARLKNLQVQTVDHLGSLIPELEKSDIYLVPRDLSPKLEEDAGAETSPDGKSVYARTFAEPHAATRFFPAALMLNEEQLIALHIHEALHRALPASVREDEAVVSKITLALTSPDSSIDRVRKVVSTEVSSKAQLPAGSGPPLTVVINNETRGGRLTSRSQIESPDAELESPSSITYSYKVFSLPENKKNPYPIQSMHSIQSLLYPFGSGARAFGLGLQFSYIRTLEQSFVGPISLSGRVRLISVRGFDVGTFATLALNTMSADELKNSPLGRDVTTVGLTLRRDTDRYYIENALSYSGQGEASQRLGQIDTKYLYGATTAATMRAGAKLNSFELGAAAEMLLNDFFRVTAGAYDSNFGRTRVITAGPEFAYSHELFRFALSGRWVIDSTPGVNLNYFGDLMGRGVGQGFVSTSAALRF